MTNKKGFTLVELLVVVGIIGILASIGVASLNSARQKARDAKRIADVKQMSTIIEAEEGSIPNQTMVGCTGAFTKRTAECTAPGADINTLFVRLLDPSTKKDADGKDTGSPCKSKAEVCSYSIANQAGSDTASTADYQICFYLESGAAGLPAGLASIKSGGVLAKGCNVGAAKKTTGAACTAGDATECALGVCKADSTCP